MDSLVAYNNNSKIQEGKKITESNDFLRDLSVLMENEVFKRFFDKYMQDWSDIKCTTIYMRLYSEFKQKYKAINDEELNRYIVIYLLRKVMCDKNLRPFSIKAIEKIHENEMNRKKFWKEFEKFIVKNNNQMVLE
tara:strand:+ start:323 stop:727 length:405 start_codon:yes stop_codon:yes gene_type:complete